MSPAGSGGPPPAARPPPPPTPQQQQQQQNHQPTPGYGNFMATNGQIGPSSATVDGSALAADGTRIPNILPHERVFPIQIGSELFKLSGASLSSDAPSYFSQYFQCQLKMGEAATTATMTEGSNAEGAQAAVGVSPPIRTLYIDRDPATFRDIALHLQGYHVQPRDGTHFVRLFADAQFYSLPRLISQLYEQPIFMSIGHREFQIPRDLFQDPGNAPNYFTLGFAVFFSTPDNLFPGLDRAGLLRPPSILPPAVTGRSAETFAELLHLLRGYPVEIRSEEHRQTLLRDCRYFNFRGLEQKLLPHALSYNQARGRHEIVLRVEDVLKSGLSVRDAAVGSDSGSGGDSATQNPSAPPTPTAPQTTTTPSSWVHYARPYVDDKPAELVLEIGGENTKLHFWGSFKPTGKGVVRLADLARCTVRAEFFRDTKTRMVRLFEVLATKLNLPTTTKQPLGLLMACGAGGAGSQPPSPEHTPLSDDAGVLVELGPDTALVLDGRPVELGEEAGEEDEEGGGAEEEGSDGIPPRKRRRVDDHSPLVSPVAFKGTPPSWIVKTGQWRLRIRATPPATPDGKPKMECVLVGVKLEAATSELARNRTRGFLG